MFRKPARDGRGRWQKGHCPNPSGRPRKKPDISDADINHFRKGVQIVTINGEQRRMTREEALVHAMYDKAMKGSVLIMRKLFDRFEQSETTMTEGRGLLQELTEKFLDKYNKTDVFDERLHQEIEKLREMLSDGHTFKPLRPRRVKARDEPAFWRGGNEQPQSVVDLLALEEAQYWADAADKYIGELTAIAVWKSKKAGEALAVASAARRIARADPEDVTAARALEAAATAASQAGDEADDASAQVAAMKLEVEKAYAELAEAEDRFRESSRLQAEATKMMPTKRIGKK